MMDKESFPVGKARGGRNKVDGLVVSWCGTSLMTRKTRKGFDRGFES